MPAQASQTMGGDGMKGVGAMKLCGATTTGAGHPGAAGTGEALGHWAMTGPCMFSGDGEKLDHPAWTVGPPVVGVRVWREVWGGSSGPAAGITPEWPECLTRPWAPEG